MTDTVTVTQAGQTVVLPVTAIQVVETSTPGPQGPQGPSGPDPWAEAVQTIDGIGAVTIDYSLGKHVQLTVIGNITSLSIINWPVSGRLGRLTLEILNQGPFNISSYGTAKFSGGGVPALTPNGIDMFIFTTINSGSRVLGNVVGQGYL